MKITRTREGIFLSGELPPEIVNAQSAEIFPLRDGAFIILPKGFLESAEKSKSAATAGEKKQMLQLNERERGLVRKLLSIRFDMRNPTEVAKALSKDEKPLLESLLKKGVVQSFHSAKYPNGVYNVSDEAFNTVREPAGASAAVGGAPPPVQQAQPIVFPVSSPEHLEKNGWMVLETENDARSFANSFPEKIKSGEVRGVRAFDLKFYFVKKGFLEKWEHDAQLSLGKGEKTAEEIAAEIGIPAMGCRALLLHMCENGDLMEKKKGKFARA